MASTIHQRPYKRLCILSVAMYVVSLFSLHAAYSPPDMEKELFNTEELQLDKFTKAGLVGALVSVARDFNEKDHKVTYTTRAYALAIAGRIDRNSTKVRDCLTQLRKDGRTHPQTNADRQRTADRLYSGIRSLMRKKDNDANQTCAAFCLDIALSFELYNNRLERLNEYKENLKGIGFTADWTGLLETSARRNNRNKAKPPSANSRHFLPGDNTQLPLKESRINGLYFATSFQYIQDDQKPTPIILTAVEDKSQKGLLFQFQHPVGSSLSQSLEYAVEFLKTFYDKSEIPSGYKVMISMNHGVKPVNNHRQGITLAIAIDSLITGEAIHDRYCNMGRINKEGESMPTNQISRVIAYAINQNHEIVGIPHASSRSAHDFFLLRGVAELLKINIFAEENFADARKTSRKNRTPDLQEAITLYAELGHLIRKMGLDVIEQPQAKDILNKILEKAPNHLCARVLLDYSTNKSNKLSLCASFEELDYNRIMYRSALDSSTKDLTKQYIQQLEKVKNSIDPRLMNYFERTLALQSEITNGSKQGEDIRAYKKRIDTAYTKASAERKKIVNDPELRREIGR